MSKLKRVPINKKLMKKYDTTNEHTKTSNYTNMEPKVEGEEKTAREEIINSETKTQAIKRFFILNPYPKILTLTIIEVFSMNQNLMCAYQSETDTLFDGLDMNKKNSYQLCSILF